MTEEQLDKLSTRLCDHIETLDEEHLLLEIVRALVKDCDCDSCKEFKAFFPDIKFD